MNNRIVVDLYKKPTDRCQYLLTSSCHPPHITENIPYSLAYRIVRICSEEETRDKRLAELKNMLLSRDYKTKLIDNAIEKAKGTPRSKALERVEKTKTETRRPVLSVEYHPSLPALSSILKRHWRVMIQDPYLKEVFPLPPIVAYRRPANIRDKLIRAKIPPENSRPSRRLPGMRKCKYDCLTCPYVQTGKTVVAHASRYKHDIESQVDCQTANVIYCLSCEKCKEQYIGETEKTLAVRFRQHRGYVRNKEVEKATGEHFNKPGHTMANMKITILEKMNSQDPQLRKIRESLFIQKFNAKYRCLNKKS